MSPSEARALIGKVLLPNTPGAGTSTIRFVIKAISGESFRLQTSGGQQQRAAIAEVDLAIRRGLLQVED